MPDGLAGQQSQSAEGSLLPDIDPQDIEIRSQYQANFPGLRRQPILGFNPSPRVFQVDPNRTPFIENFEEVVSQLPVGAVSRPDAPEYIPPLFPSPQHAFGMIGAGSYLSPEAEIYANEEIGTGHWISGSLDYHSSDGHLSDQESSFRFADLEAGYRGKLSASTVLGINLGARNSFSHMFELAPDVQSDIGDAARKMNNGATMDARIIRYKNTIEHWDAGISSSWQSMDLDTGERTDLSGDLFDWNVTADGSRTWAGNRLHETYGVNLDVRTGGYELSSDNRNWHVAGLGGNYERLFDYKAKVDASLGLYHVSDAVDNSTIYLAPEVEAEYYLMDEVTIFGSVSGQPDHPVHQSYHNENPFLNPENELQHSYHFKGTAGLSAELFPGTKLRGGVSYQKSRNYPYYTRRTFSENGDDVPGFYQVNYATASVLKMYSGFGIDFIPGVFWLDAEGYFQAPKLSSGERIPFEEKYGLQGSVSIRPVYRLLFEVWGDFRGPRTNPEGSDLSQFVYLGTRVQVRIKESVGVYGKILNLMNQEYELWQGYPERPFQIYAGITLTF